MRAGDSGMREVIYIILAVLCILYGVMVLLTNSGTWFFAVWFFLAAGFIVLALCARLGVWQMLPAAGKGIFAAAAGAGILMVCVTGFCIASAYSEKGEPDLDYLIVLGAQIKETGPSVVLRYRLDTAAAYLEMNPETVCIVTGARGYNEPVTEARGMADYLIGKGIGPERILLEDKATNTVENIRYSREFLDAETDRVGIVTNNFHMFRAVHIAKRQGIVHVCGIAAPSGPIYVPNNVLREMMGIVKDFLKGNLA